MLAVIALLVFGPKRLPELGRALGSGLRGFKDAVEGDDEDRPAAVADAEGPAQGSGAGLQGPAATAAAEPTTGQTRPPDGPQPT